MLSRRVSLPKCISPSGNGKDASSRRKSITKPSENGASSVENDHNSNSSNSMEIPPPLSVSVSASSLASASPVKDPHQQPKDNAIKVVIRVRPLSEKELLAKSPVIVNVNTTSVQVVNPALFTDPTFLDAISSATRKYSSVNLPVSLSSTAITAASQAGECRSFHFDRCFGVDNAAATTESEPFANTYDIDVASQRPNQELVFEEIGKDMIPSAFQGFNCTVFAYGQTGSGKTHTMVGEKTTMRGKGVIPRVCEALFQGIDARRAKEIEVADALEASGSDPTLGAAGTGSGSGKKTVFTVHMSYCEIYKEKVHDLLDSTGTLTPTSSFSVSSSSMTHSDFAVAPVSPVANSSSFSAAPSSSNQRGKVLKVREHPVTGPFVEGLSSRLVNSYEEISEEMLAGDKLRTVAATLMNPVSSRSHAMFTLTLTQTTFDGVTNVPTVKTSKIALIDLAGSERANVSGTSGDRLKEGAMINKSLTTLGRVISALSKTSSASSTERVPYRDSTLTWLLKESLGGNAKTTMIAMVSPAAENFDETMSTLRYAESAKRVMNRAVVNEDPNARIIRQLRDEVQQLRDQLAIREKEAFYLAENLKDNTVLPASVQDRDEFYHAMQDEMESYKTQVDTLLHKHTQHEELLNKTSRVVRLHAEYPSLVNCKPATALGSDDVLVCTLKEGVTLVGSEPHATSAAPIVTTHLEENAVAAANDPGVSPTSRLTRTTSWAGSFLKRRKSSAAGTTIADASVVAAVRDDDGRTTSPRKPRSLSRRSSRDLGNAHESDPEEPTSFVRLVNCSDPRDGDYPVLARHAMLFVHGRVVPPASDMGDSLLETVDEIEYVVELQPVDAHAAVFVNGHRVTSDARTRVVHGDVVAFGSSHCFRLHVPGVAANAPAVEAALAREAKKATPFLPSEPIPLDELVAEANTICSKWHLGMEMAISSGVPAIDEDQETVEPPADAIILVKKQLHGNRACIIKWPRAVLEEKLVVLRQLAASLELELADGSHAGAEIEQVERNEELVAIAMINEENEDQEPIHDSHDRKLSVARNADRVSDSERDESVGDDSRSAAIPASMSNMDGRYSTTIDTTTAPGHHATHATTTTTTTTAPHHQTQYNHSASPPQALCVRLLGTARVYLSGALGSTTQLSQGDGVALSTAVYDSRGTQIARMHCHLRPVVVPDSSVGVSAAQSAKLEGEASMSAVRRSFSFLSPRSSQASATNSAMASRGSTSGATPATQGQAQRVQVIVDRLDFLETAATSEQISLTLKKWSASRPTATDSDPATGASGGGSGSGAGSIESTPKVSASGRAIFTIHHTMQLANVVSDDYLSIEVWGYGDVVAPQLASSSAISTQTQASGTSSPSPSPAPQQIELFVSVDIEERDADGFFRPVAVKSDGTLRLHVNQPRRVSLRITQADHGPFVLQDVCVAQLSPAFTTRGATNLAIGDGKSTQSLLLPPPLGASPSGTTCSSACSSARSAATTEVEQLPTFRPWCRLFPRAAAELDVTSRSLTVSLRWEHSTNSASSSSSASSGEELNDGEDARSVFRLAVACSTILSRVPVVVSKSIVTKLSSTAVTSSQRLAREWEHARTAWWARESFSRSYRLGTWYSVDVVPSSLQSSPLRGETEPTMDADLTGMDENDQAETTTLATRQELLASAASTSALTQITAHIDGLRRLELCVAMERVRQEIVATYQTTRISDEYPLTLERAQECFELLLRVDPDIHISDDKAVAPPVVKVLQLDDGVVYLRHKANKDIFVAVETGDVTAIASSGSGGDSASGVDHITHFVSEPTALAADPLHTTGGGSGGGSSGQMCGFLMFSTSVQLDESAVASVAATTATSSSSSAPLSSNPLAWARNSLSNRLSWERRWFVLKRPFLYAYKSFARKEHIGVLDVAKCQLVVSVPIAPGQRRQSLPGMVTRRGGKPDHGTGSGEGGGRGGGGGTASAFPFCFQLVSLAGGKSVVWSLQGSTQAELRAWLVAIDPLKIEAREAVTSAAPDAAVAVLTA